MRLVGSDYSKHNGNNGVQLTDEFCILRAGFGRGNRDVKFLQNVKKCNERGIPWGAYWFSYACDVDMARSEAYTFCTMIKELRAEGIKPEFPLYYDNEYDSNDYFHKINGRHYTKEEYNEMCKRFCECVEHMGYYAGIYVNKDYFKNYLDDENKDRFSLWLADYNCIEDEFKGRHKNVHVVQYTNVPFDRDVSRIDFPSVIKKAGLNGW